MYFMQWHLSWVKYQFQPLCKQHLGAKAIMAAYPDKGWALSTMKKICHRVDRMGSAAVCKPGCGRLKSACSEANIAALKELICLQEGETVQHSSNREIAAKLNISDRSVRRIREAGSASYCICSVPAQVISDATKEKWLHRSMPSLCRFKVCDRKQHSLYWEKKFCLNPLLLVPLHTPTTSCLSLRVHLLCASFCVFVMFMLQNTVFRSTPISLSAWWYYPLDAVVFRILNL